MENNILNIQPREVKGKGGARQLRMQGFTPGIYYLKGEANIPFYADTHELSVMLGRGLKIVTLKMEGEKSRDCIVREIQRDPVSDDLVHIDFMGMIQGEVVKISVPVHLIGIAAGTKRGGILEHGMSSLEIECLPSDIPNSINVDVSELDIGQSIHLRSLNIEGIKFLDDPNNVLATVVTPSIHKEDAPAAPTEEEESKDTEE